MGAADPLSDVHGGVRPVYDAARTFARDLYLSALLAPADARDDLVEIVMVGEGEVVDRKSVV